MINKVRLLPPVKDRADQIVVIDLHAMANYIFTKFLSLIQWNYSPSKIYNNLTFFDWFHTFSSRTSSLLFVLKDLYFVWA